MRKALCALALLASLSATSCIGPNNAFNGINAWNSGLTESRIANELIYIGLWIVPVYEVTLGLDAVVFNSLEFWGAGNPIGTPNKFETQAKR